MKRFVSIIALSMVVFGANAAQNGRLGVSGRIIMSAPRSASINQLNGMTNITNVVTKTTKVEEVVVKEEPKVDMREAERNACINNNIGMGNTFVWASRYSDTSNYSNMIEDTANPQNNVCFVKVELKSDNESRVVVNDIAPKYFMWGENIECGSWVSEKEMEKRILDARKGARIGGIVASTVGGAGLGVGAMELFGNRLIGGAVEGQRSNRTDDKTAYHKAEIDALRTSDASKFEEIRRNLRVIKQAHDANAASVPDYDTKYKYLVDAFAAD